MTKRPTKTRAERRRKALKASTDERAVEIPKCANAKARAAAESSLWAFGQAYFAHRFYLPAAPIHRELADKLNEVIHNGGNYALVLPRGSAKTTWMEIAAIYATFSALRRFVVICGGTAELAEAITERIRGEIETNEELLAAYPEICAPVRALEGVAVRSKTMLDARDNSPIRFEWKAGKITLPDVEGAEHAGSIIMPRGIEGSLRGLMHKLPSGKSVRPDLVLVDDPQTRESAASPNQVRERINTINGDLLGLAGPRRKVAALVSATVIKRNDAADQLTDPRLFPAWQGRRVPMVIKWPVAHESLWMKDYADARRDAQRAGDVHAKAATDFYVANRAAMDEGAEVYWPERFNDDEVSAIQNAYNLLIDNGPEVFFSEYQNDPKPPLSAAWELTADDVIKHVSEIPRGRVPDVCDVLAMGCDVNLYGLNWVLSAWSSDGIGYIVDYGKYPATDAPIWKQGSALTEDQAIFAAIHALLADVSARPYVKHESGERVNVGVVAIDCGYRRDAVFHAVSSARLAHGGAVLFPIKAFSTRSYKPLNSQRKGDGWHSGAYGPAKALFVNADIYRERAQKGFLLPVGCPGGSIALYGSRPEDHRALADHVTAERVTDVLHSDKSGTTYQWSQIPGRKNDLLDALTYSLAAAAYMGVRFGGTAPERRAKQQPVDMPVRADGVQPASTARVLRPPSSAMHHRPRRGGFVTNW